MSSGGTQYDAPLRTNSAALEQAFANLSRQSPSNSTGTLAGVVEGELASWLNLRLMHDGESQLGHGKLFRRMDEVHLDSFFALIGEFS
jgi:hypothetical protein